MFKHYLTTALRHFRRHKLTTSINVVCLTIGLVCYLAIYATVTYISSADKHFANADRVYVITTKVNAAGFDPLGPWPIAKYLKTDIPEIETVARASADVGLFNEMPIATGDRKSFVTVAYADADFFKVFALPFAAGDARNALRVPYSAVLSKETAIRLFGSASGAIDKRLQLPNGKEITVRGVLGNIPQPSHIQTGSNASFASVRFDALLSMDVFEQSMEADPSSAVTFTSWQIPYFLTYVVLPRDGSFTVDNLRQRLQSFGKHHADSGSDIYQFGATSVSDYKLAMFSSAAGSEKTGISVTLMFYVLGALVLLISCLNYANLATAQAATRAKEIGMRRVVGASRGQIIVQFVFEAALSSLGAFLCALLLTTLAISALSIPGMSDVVLATLATSGFWLTAFGLLTGVTMAAGIYPAFVLSNVRPIQAVRAGRVRSGGRFVPRLLVGLQFLGASFLLIAMLVMVQENSTLKQSALNGSPNAMVVMSNNIHDAKVDFDVFQTELLRQPHIQAVTASQFSPWGLLAMPLGVSHSSDAAQNPIPTTRSIVNYDFFSTMNIHLLAGRVFDRQHAKDKISVAPGVTPTTIASVVIDRALAEQNGWLHPTDALGKTLYSTEFGTTHKPPVRLNVIGVVENRPIGIASPFGATSNIFELNSAAASFPIVRIATTDGAAALNEIKSVWNKLAPSVAIKMQFADEQLNDNYRTLSSVATVFIAIATLALVISILGLIGMSIQIISRRQHEIGVRKTLGASVRSIVQLLLADFSKPVIVANLLAWPVAFIAMRLYLSLFVTRSGLSITPFIASLALTLLIAWLAVAAQATRAARMNPATVLRTE